MKFRMVFVLLLYAALLQSQTNGAKKSIPKQVPASDMRAYFISKGLSTDSALTPYLFAQVYEWVGTRYHYSGDTKKGIDCSGFVSKMYKAVYCIDLAGGSRAIYSTVDPVEKKDLKEGDMVFFKIKKGQISHIGIYLGNNKFAHASVQSGVIISDLDEEYYKNRFYKGGRLRSNNK